MFVTPGDRPPAVLTARVREVLRGGVTAVLLREPQLPPADRVALAGELRALTAEHGALLLVNRESALARSCGADGVHTGFGGPEVAALRRDAPGLCVGRSCHWPVEPDDLAADYVLVSPFRPTGRSHPRPLLRNEQARAVLELPGMPPAVALGGLSAHDVPELPAGLCGVAAVRALADAPEARRAAEGLLAAVRERLRGGTRFGPPAPVAAA